MGFAYPYNIVPDDATHSLSWKIVSKPATLETVE